MNASHIDFRTMPQHVPSLCIPRVFANINEARIRKIFAELHMGIIQRVDIISKFSAKGEKLNRVFIHFKAWASNSNANSARERLLNGKEIKIIYDDPWFWKISAYREPTPKAKHSKPPVQKRPILQLDEDEDKDEYGRNKSLRPEPQQTLQPIMPNSPQNTPPPLTQQDLNVKEEKVIYKGELDLDEIQEPIAEVNYGATEKLIPKKRSNNKKPPSLAVPPPSPMEK